MFFNVDKIQEIIGYKFKNPNILRECFTHPSYVNEHKEYEDYDRLEFLGDSVLGFVVADYLFRNGNKTEGAMTENKKSIVSKVPLSIASKRLNLNEYILKSETLSVTDSICENVFEAIIGGIYLDGGILKAKKFIYEKLISVVGVMFYSIKQDKLITLKEYVEQNALGSIEYVKVSKTGKDHEPTWRIKLLLNNEEVCDGFGTSVKKAEQKVAEKALEILKKWR